MTLSIILEKKIKIPEIQAEREKTMLYQTCKHVLVMILYTLQVILECLIMYQNGHFVEFVLMAVCAVMVPVLVFAGILPTCLRRNGKGPDMEKRKFCFFVYASMWCANFTTWYIICYVAEKFIPGLLADVMPLIGLVSVAFGIGTVEKRNAC